MITIVPTTTVWLLLTSKEHKVPPKDALCDQNIFHHICHNYPDHPSIKTTLFSLTPSAAVYPCFCRLMFLLLFFCQCVLMEIARIVFFYGPCQIIYVTFWDRQKKMSSLISLHQTHYLFTSRSHCCQQATRAATAALRQTNKSMAANQHQTTTKHSLAFVAGNADIGPVHTWPLGSGFSDAITGQQ